MLATDPIPAPVAGALRQTWDRARRRVLPPRCSHGACRSRRLANLWTAKSPLWFRGSWFCSPSCAEPAIHRYLAQLAWAPLPPALPPHRVPLGLLLLSRGDVSESQLQLALDAQRQNQARKIGEWLQLLQFVTEQQVLAALGVQWALPLLASPEAVMPGAARLLPAVLRRELQLVPVRLVEATRELYLATSQRVEHTTLASIEHMLGCRVRPCLVSARVLRSWLSPAHPDNEDLAQHFVRPAPLSEIVRIISSYAARLRCEDVRIARCGPYLWVRLGGDQEPAHLLFRPAESSVASLPQATAV